MLARRALALAGIAAALGGCGFHPLYERSSTGGPGAAARELAAVSVDVIPDRPGQVLRQALQERLEGSGDSLARRYTLSVDYGISGEGIAIRSDNSVTRLRFVGRAQWTLRAQDADRTVMTRNIARAVDDINIFNEQYFAADLETEAAQQRIANTVADQIVLQLGSYFTRRADQTASAR